MESHPYLLHRQCRLISATVLQLFGRLHIKTVLSISDLIPEPSSEQQLTLVQDDSAGLLCPSAENPHFRNPIFQLLVPRVTHHGRVHAVCFTQRLVGACCGLLVVHMAVHELVALRRCTTASELVAPSRSFFPVSQSHAPALDPVDPCRLLGLDCRRVIHKTLPNEFDRYDPSVLRGWAVSSLNLRNLDQLDHQLTSSWMVGFFLCPVSVMLWGVLLVLVCFTTVSTTLTTRSTVRRGSCFTAVIFGISASQ